MSQLKSSRMNTILKLLKENGGVMRSGELKRKAGIDDLETFRSCLRTLKVEGKIKYKDIYFYEDTYRITLIDSPSIALDEVPEKVEEEPEEPEPKQDYTTLDLVEKLFKEKKFSDDDRSLYRYLVVDIKDGSWFFAKHGDAVIVPENMSKGNPFRP